MLCCISSIMGKINEERFSNVITHSIQLIICGMAGSETERDHFILLTKTDNSHDIFHLSVLPLLQYHRLILFHTKTIDGSSYRIAQSGTRFDSVLMQQIIQKDFSFHIEDALTSTDPWT